MGEDQILDPPDHAEIEKGQSASILRPAPCGTTEDR